MCTHPLTINHPSKDYHLSDPMQLTIDCGQCYECRRKKASAIETRIYSQLVHNKQNGLRNYFCTLTFDEYSLPRIELPDGTLVECFDRNIWTNFIRNLQKQLKRKYKIGSKGGYPPINYMVCSEKGGTYGRPHHHVVLGVSRAISPQDLHALVVHYWQGDSKKDSEGNVELDDSGNAVYNGYGYVFPRYCMPSRTKKGFEILGDPSTASKYVAKYVCKDLSFYSDNQELAEYLAYYKDLKKKLSALGDDISDDEISQLSEAEDVLNDIKPYLPFWTSTQNYGACIMDMLRGSSDQETLDNISRGVKVRRYSKKLQNYTSSYVPVPQYVLRKMLFDIRYTTDKVGNYVIRYDLNNLGLLYKQQIYDKCVSDLSRALKNTYVLAKLNQYERIKPFYTAEIDFDLLAIYKLTYKDRILPYLYKESYVQTQKFDFDLYDEQNLRDLARHYSIIDPIRNVDGVRMSAALVKKYYHKTFNEIPIFAKYDFLLRALDDYDLDRNTIKSKINELRVTRDQKIKHLSLLL